jgi:hypothetical protein
VTVTEALRTRTIVVPRLTIAKRVAEIEALAHRIDATPHSVWVTLRSVAHGSLWGDALWAAWMRAEAAILIRDATDEDDGDYPGYADEADAAITSLVHGTTYVPRTGGTA